ncbi:toll/interleukin-1 receptor domain-containing protein [Luteolibacter yonseiensis]|uniref:Toll/interleukin-1 receptor domain-containing protein n=1 Tax=Luteolibacter yonseiensis TaxID=1144680 RepID=A0A934R491_9BACT|nr:TIR domain-containing protein [Luteolibacter yonseiensis]MBK1814990.1 toll/interleukin-1 receptor domain-containing protein [Luteolibacter yonseiensis]
MKVFISWSKERSRLIAELLSEWLVCVIQATSPWVSSRDIDRGSLWFSEIGNALQDVTAGIVCITEQNKNEPWILFEAGALCRGLSTQRVITLLVDLEPKDIGDPLAQFNHALPTRDGMRALVRTINKNLGVAAVPDPTLEKVFETFWPLFESKFREIIDDTTPDASPSKKTKVDPLEQIHEILRRLDIRTRETHSALSALAQPTQFRRGRPSATGIGASLNYLIRQARESESGELAQKIQEAIDMGSDDSQAENGWPPVAGSNDLNS